MSGLEVNNLQTTIFSPTQLLPVVETFHTQLYRRGAEPRMAKSLKQYFFPNKPDIRVTDEIGEITIYLPTINDRLNPLYYELSNKTKLYLSCPINITCLSLKLRIKGIIKIDVERIVLLYLGAVLENDQV